MNVEAVAEKFYNDCFCERGDIEKVVVLAKGIFASFSFIRFVILLRLGYP